MAVEPKRGCGYRKQGGLYLVCDEPGMPCCQMPIMLHICPTCSQGIKQSRGWQWLDPRPFVPGKCTRADPTCPLANPARMGDRVGLIWIGTQFYPTPEHFTVEAERLGISRRIKTIPRGFVVGKTWVFFAHPHVQRDRETGQWTGGVFRIARPTRIEKIVTDIEAADTVEMDKLRERGITPVIVPHDDPAHKGTVYDKEMEFV